MNISPESNASSLVHGQQLHLSGRYQVAIYTRGGVCWVAEFNDGHGVLTDAGTWFRVHAGELRYSHGKRAAALESATELSHEMLAQIERLHRDSH